jgi:hypothetical protein
MILQFFHLVDNSKCPDCADPLFMIPVWDTSQKEANRCVCSVKNRRKNPDQFVSDVIKACMGSVQPNTTANVVTIFSPYTQYLIYKKWICCIGKCNVLIYMYQCYIHVKVMKFCDFENYFLFFCIFFSSNSIFLILIFIFGM